MGISEDIDALHRQTSADLVAVGPAAPSGLAGWSAADLSAHLVSQYGFARLGLGVVRFAMARGLRPPGRSVPRTNALAVRLYQRRAFDEATARSAQSPPFPLKAQPVAAIELFEIWTHGDDLRRANGLGEGLAPDSLESSVQWLTRFHRRALNGQTVDNAMSLADQMRWLTGRPSPQPQPGSPLSI